MLIRIVRAFVLGLLRKGFRSVRTLRKGEQILRVVDRAEIKVMAVEELHLRLPSGINLLLHDVIYAPSIKTNLISIMILTNSGGFPRAAFIPSAICTHAGSNGGNT
uniref:Retrovirus-related Pol polyprotein from transposon TNT 1-94-like beta-barrel domain-containing protein n=1 Tax=Oryza glumipatula TaxID=40148 RepID=A0A0D9ZIA3_9ORYZ